MRYNNEGKSRETRGGKPVPTSPRGTSALQTVSENDIVFVNIEGVPELSSFDNLSADMQRLWDSASAAWRPAGVSASEAYAEAGTMAEFGKVACITAGVIRHREGETDPFFITSTYSGDSERDVLCGFAEMVGNFLSTPAQDHMLCGHGVLRAGIPFFAKRLIVNNIQLPSLFDKRRRRKVADSVIDTADYWAFTETTGRPAPAELLGRVLGLDVEQDDFDPRVAADLYHTSADMTPLIGRSERKALLYAQILRRFRGESVILPDRVISKK